MTPIYHRIQNRFFRYFPRAYWNRYCKRAASCGVKKLYLLLSFDCDRDEDISAAESLNTWLLGLGITATFAVPGRQLLAGADTYRRIAATGAEFINHGARPHTEFRDGRYRSITFYDEMSEVEVEEDIRTGHTIVTEVIGQPPCGFRAPHFGSFQSRKQLALQYRVLRDLGYLFSTSTLPRVGFSYGPVRKLQDLYEIPLTGSYTYPLNILDSWEYVVDHYRSPVISPIYRDLFVETVDRLLEMNGVGVLNYYADPSHVCGTIEFKDSIQHLLDSGIEAITYPRLLGMLDPSIRK